jgi:hypothetical protein
VLAQLKEDCRNLDDIYRQKITKAENECDSLQRENQKIKKEIQELRRVNRENELRFKVLKSQNLKLDGTNKKLLEDLTEIISTIYGVK